MTPLSYHHADDERGLYLIVTCARGYQVMIDTVDLPILSDHVWRCYKSTATFYVTRYGTRDGKRAMILLHREIMRAPPELTVDHIDWNGLNDRRHNMRLVTPQQNFAYVRPDKTRNGRGPETGHRGVYPTESG